nr:HTH-type transcriptional regulator SgrR [Candidatus Pantoea persica]
MSLLHWRFFIRPAVRFHHSRELEMEDVAASLERLRAQPLFSHIRAIDSPAPWTLDIYLSAPDDWLPWLLGSVSEMILPCEWPQMRDFARQPVGTGPYRVVRNQQSQMKIKAFNDYFGFRALIDDVSVWVLQEISDEVVYFPAYGCKAKRPMKNRKRAASKRAATFCCSTSAPPKDATPPFAAGSAIC